MDDQKVPARAGIEFCGFSIIEWQNTYHQWYFSDTDRVRTIIEGETSEESFDFLGYKAKASQIKRRLNLAGYSKATLNKEFCEVICLWSKNAQSYIKLLEEASEEYSDGLLNDYRGYLRVFKKYSLEDWIERLSIIKDKKSLIERPELDDELLKFMLHNDFDEYPHHTMGSNSFPCWSSEAFAIAVLEFANEDETCELNISELVSAGWAEDFDDIAQVQSGKSTFYHRYLNGIQELSELSILLRENPIQQKIVYANVISVLEHYLSDTLKKQVLNRQAIKRRFVESSSHFREKEKKIPLNDIFKVLDEIEKKINQSIDSISFHNINIAEKLYSDVLQISFPEGVRKQLENSIEVRHDIVHRNGHDSKGEPKLITDHDVSSLISTVNHTVEHIDKQLLDGLLD